MSVYRAMRARREHVDRGAACPLSPTARAVWADLAGRVDYDGACWPTVGTLCDALGVGERTVQRAIGELVAYGVVDVIVAHGRGRRNTYRLELATEETRHERRVSEPVDNERNPSPVTENPSWVTPHIGEVVKRSRRETSPHTIEETRHPRRVSESVDARAAYERYAADMRATGQRVLTPAVYFSIVGEAMR